METTARLCIFQISIVLRRGILREITSILFMKTLAFLGYVPLHKKRSIFIITKKSTKIYE
jgi:hypothetical protein